MELDVLIEIPRGSRNKLDDLPHFDRLEIEHFFLIYKELEPGKSVEGAGWADRAAAEAEVEASRQRLRANHAQG
jgi:inorganic pyrophosphatase